MSLATLRRYPLPALGPDAWRLEVDCCHAVTGVTLLPAPGGVQLTDADAVRLALQQHHLEEGCRCTRKLWREYFDAPLGQVVLVRGQPPGGSR